jgi:hypothetical protein
MINTVKIQGNSFLVNDSITVHKAEGNRHYQEVQDWLLGKIEAWKEVEQAHLSTQAEHDNWLDIQFYDADVFEYNSWDETSEVERPDYPVKPKGYYTQEEVDASIKLHDAWQAEFDAFVATEESPTFLKPEPDLLQLPADIAEPVVVALPTPVPNVPELEFTQAELDDNAQQQTNQESLKYLTSTDWYVIRFQETGVAVPQAILDEREAARLVVM